MREPEAPSPASGSVLTGEGAPNPNARGEIGTAQAQNANDGRGVDCEENERGDLPDVDMDEIVRNCGLEGFDSILLEMQTQLDEEERERTGQHTGTRETERPRVSPPRSQQTGRAEAQPAPQGQRKKDTYTKRAGTRLTTLNIKGFGHEKIDHLDNKWNHISQYMRDSKIGILVVQETHMDAPRCASVANFFDRLQIYASGDPESPRTRNRIAIVINKDIVKETAVTSHRVLIPGRAMELSLQLHQGTEVKILGVYAPNNRTENKDFWNKLSAKTAGSRNEKKPDIMLGDMNMVEDAIDRLPMHYDGTAQANTMDLLRTGLQLIDGWRETFPDWTQYTFSQCGSPVHSRLDRIYLTRKMHDTAQGWEIRPSGIPGTDHDAALTILVDMKAPTTGRGQWPCPLFLTKDKILIGKIQNAGMRAQAKTPRKEDRSNENNAQRVWQSFKNEVMTMARERKKQIVPKLIKQAVDLEKEMTNLSANHQMDQGEKGRRLEELRRNLWRTVEKRHLKIRRAIQLKIKMEGETMTKTFAAQGRERPSRDLMYALEIGKHDDGSPIYERDSPKMAEVAKSYHDELQTGDISAEENKEEREQAIKESIESIDRKPMSSCKVDI
jgi:exonuclease III